jgi:hypothetical protein
MRTRLIIIGALLCAAIQPAALAASVHAQARHSRRHCNVDCCVPLNSLIFNGGILRAC